VSSILDELASLETKDVYDALPASIKSMYTRREWLWFSDTEKRDLVMNECMPEFFDD
jgi:hypothetical protein